MVIHQTGGGGVTPNQTLFLKKRFFRDHIGPFLDTQNMKKSSKRCGLVCFVHQWFILKKENLGFFLFGKTPNPLEGGLANHHTFPYFFCETFPKTPELHIRWKRLVDQVKSMCICLHLSLPAPWQLSVTSLSNISKICFFTNSRLHRELSRIIRSQTETRK